MSDEQTEHEGEPRRTFLTSVSAIAVGAAATLVPIFAGVVALFDPLRRRGETSSDMVLVTKLSAIPDNGQPHKFTVTMDRVDAWTTYANTPVGAVYLRRTSDGLSALNVVCPHAGCFVGVTPDKTRFACP